MHWRDNNPYPNHTWHRFVWNVYHLLTYQFARYAVLSWILLVLAISIGFHKLENLAGSNQDRIADIQASRIESCRIIFEGNRNVFKPLIPPKKDRTAKEQRNINKFNHSITREKRRCVHNVLSTGKVKK